MRSLIALSICLILVQTFVHEASAQSALTRRRSFTNRDFVFDLFKSTPTATGAGGNGKLVDVTSLKPLQGLGVSSVIFEIEPCAINLPHVHPRATELFHVLQGSFTTAFLEENTGRVIENQLTVGQVTVFPQGLVHFEQNLGCRKAVFLSAFSSEDAGVVTLSTRLFDFNQQSLTSTFNQTDAVINSLRESVRSNPAVGRGECLARCGLTRPNRG